MTTFSDLQAAFFEMLNIVESRYGWIISVYEKDDDPRIHGTAWHQDGDLILMSDDLYDLYCAYLGMENTNYRPERGGR